MERRLQPAWPMERRLQPAWPMQGAREDAWRPRLRSPWAMRAKARAPCVDETMKPTSESLSPSGTWNRRVAECYCGAAMRRGELHEANDQPQTKVNSIRPGHLASRRRGGMRPRGWVPCEACGYGHKVFSPKPLALAFASARLQRTELRLPARAQCPGSRDPR